MYEIEISDAMTLLNIERKKNKQLSEFARDIMATLEKRTEEYTSYKDPSPFAIFIEDNRLRTKGKELGLW